MYLDWAAATPLLPEAKAAMLPFLSGDFGNPSAIHKEGSVARQAVEGARDKVARTFKVRPEFITFTSGGTEANNIAILGSIKKLVESGSEYCDLEVVTTKIEHPSVSRAFDELESLGVKVKYVAVDETGLINLTALRELLSAKTALVSVSYINSEIGTIQKLHAIKKVLKEAEEVYGNSILFHVDAAQAPLWVNCQFDTTQADYLALDAAKCCGPKGVGVLVQSRRAAVSPVTFGGGQEAGLRPGTENVAGVVGAAVALEAAQADWKSRQETISLVRDQAIKYLLAEVPEALINGAFGADRVANNINISLPLYDTEFMAVVLDKHGFAVSTKSACSGAGGGESAVVKEISADPSRAASTLRITSGSDTTLKDLQRLTAVLRKHLDKMSAYIK